MDIKEFRTKYAKDVSLEVCRKAYAYYCNGHEIEQALITASVIYGEKFITGKTLETGFWLEQKDCTVNVFVLHTATIFALRHLLKNPSVLQSAGSSRLLRKKLIAMYGCNCMFDTKSFAFPNAVIGIYNHNGCYAAVVALQGCSPEKLGDKSLQDAANVLAKNAVAWQGAYLLNPAHYYNAGVDGEQNLKYGEPYKEWILRQPVRFAPGVNPRFEILQQYSSSTVTIRDYLRELSKRHGCEISITSIDIFGSVF